MNKAVGGKRAAPIGLALVSVLCLILSDPANAVQFEPLTPLQTGIGSTGVLTLGPEDPDPGSNKDGCIYAVNAFGGTVSRICFDSNKQVTGVAPYTASVVVDINGPGGGVNALLGIVFEPASDPGGTMVLYLAYSDDNGAPFNGKIGRAVSTDGGLTYSVDEDFITGLPRMNESHQTNGLRFGPVDGCLYIAQGNNSNAGYDYAFAESRLSGAILLACFNTAPLTVDPGFDRNCGAGTSQEGCDIEVYASGMRNPFDLVWHSNGNLYSSDNDANSTFRQADPPTCNVPANTFGCPCQANPGDPSDELNLVEQGKYYGSPNPYLAMPTGLQCQGGTAGGDACASEGSDCPGGGTCMDLSALCTDMNCSDPLLCTYFGGDTASPTAAEDPGGIYRASILPQSSTPGNLLIAGLDEYNGAFCSDWSSDLLASGAPGSVNRLRLVAGGTAATFQGSANLNGATGLDVVVGRDGTVYVADFYGGQVTYLEPIVQPSPGSANYFDPNADPQNCPPPPVCGDNLAEAGEECDGTDDAACPGQCQANCTCPAGPARKIVEYRADQADGTGPYPIPGAGSPWVDLTAPAGFVHDGTLFNFAGDATSGWQGTGVAGDPYRLEYDGTNDQRVTIPAGSIPELNPTGSHSVAVWFKTSPSAGTPPANGDREMIVEWVEQYAQPYEAMSVSYVNGALYFWDCAGWIDTGAALAGDTWYHLAVSKVDLGGGSASEVRVYLDGVNVYSNLFSTCLGDQLSEIGIGAGVSSGVGTYSREMSGAIAQLCIFDGALDAAEVQTEYLADLALYAGPAICGNDVAEGAEECDGIDDAACPGQCQLDCTCPVPPGTPARIVQYRADQADGSGPYLIPGSGSPWVDLTAPPGLAHDGTLTNFAGDANSGWQGTGVPSDPYRLEYDGTNDQRVTIPAGSIPELNPTGDHSVAMWFKTSATAGTPPANNDREIVVEWVERYTSPYQATSVSYLNGFLYFWDCTGAWINTGAALTGDTWYHLVVSKIDKQIDGDASVVRVYLDGVEVYANTSSTCLGDQFSEIGVGTGVAANGSYTREMSGAIAQLSIFDGALDVAEVQTEYLADLALYNVPLTDQAGSGAGDVPTSGVRRRGTGDYSTRDGRGLGTAQPSDPTLDSPSATDVDSAAPTDPSAPAELTITSLAVPDESEGPIGCVGNDPLGRPYDSNAVCMHLSAGDGFATMADGRPLYIFSFRDVTGLDENSMPTLLDEGFLGAEAPAPTIHLDQGDQFYLSLTNVGMAIRPDLFDPHTVHYHGFPNASSAFDGVPDASISVNMNGTLTYYYNVVEPGTYMYHCHVEATEHMQMGMLGNLYVRPAQNQLPGGTDLSGFTHEAGFEYAYNDEDGSTYYDVDVPIQIGSFDADFHDASWNVQPLPFALMEDTYPLLNGRGYPDTVNPGNLATAENGNKESQRVDTRITAQTGQRILLRISNLNVTNFYTLASLGIPMQVVGKDARLHRGPTGTDLYYRTNSVTIGGGESIDVILDTRGLDGVVGTTDDIAPGTYFVYTTNLNYLSNNDEPLGGMMTEIVITAAP